MTAAVIKHDVNHLLIKKQWERNGSTKTVNKFSHARTRSRAHTHTHTHSNARTHVHARAHEHTQDMDKELVQGDQRILHLETEITDWKNNVSKVTKGSQIWKGR